MMQQTLAFRQMALEDLDRIMEIEHTSFTLPWSRESFVAEITQNHFSKYLVAILDDLVVGYAGMWVIIDEAHITNIAIHPEYRGKKLGEALLEEMMAFAIANGAERMTLEVRLSNEVAQNLYHKLGFISYGVRKGYYTDNNEDAVIMWADLPPQRAYGME